MVDSRIAVSLLEHDAGANAEHHLDPDRDRPPIGIMSAGLEIEVVLSGTLTVDSGGRRVRLAPGEVSLRNEGALYRTCFGPSGGTSIVFVVPPQAFLRERWASSEARFQRPVGVGEDELSALATWCNALILAGQPLEDDRVLATLDVFLARSCEVVPLDRLALVKRALDSDLETPVSIEALANQVSLSAGHLTRLFVGRYELPPVRYRTQRRIAAAAALVAARHDLSVAAIMERVGFEDPSHFHREFRRALGATPGRYGRRKPGGETREASRAGM